jgi:hypothetical protein
MRDLWRIALWGMAAAGAVAITVYASRTPSGHERVMLAATHLREIVKPSHAKPVRALEAREERQLAVTVRMLTEDRDRLLARIVTLEQNVGDINGSMARVEKAVETVARPSRPDAGAVQAEATPPATGAEDVTSSIGRPDSVPVPRPAPMGTATKVLTPADASKTEFGVDLGSANSIAGLRALWLTSKHRHAALLEGLRPIIHLRERPRAVPAELRLVAGPFASAASAARLCAAITAAGAVCQPALFDGQRLAIR